MKEKMLEIIKQNLCKEEDREGNVIRPTNNEVTLSVDKY